MAVGHLAGAMQNVVSPLWWPDLDVDCVFVVSWAFRIRFASLTSPFMNKSIHQSLLISNIEGASECLVTILSILSRRFWCS